MRSRTFAGMSGGVVLAVLGLGMCACRGEPAPEALPARQAPPRATPASTARASGGFLGVVIPEEAVDLSARVEARLESVGVQAGDTVREGDVVAVLEAGPLRQDLAMAEAELASAQADARVAELALTQAQERLARREDPRQLRLGALSEEEVSTARYEERMAAARRDVAQAKVRERQARVARLQQALAETRLRAPFEGVVAGRYLDPGTVVKPGQVIVHLLRTRAPRVRFAVPEREARRLTPGLPVRVEVGDGGQALTGRVARVAPEVDAASRMVFALADLTPPGEEAPPPSGAVVRVFAMPPPSEPVRMMGRP